MGADSLVTPAPPNRSLYRGGTILGGIGLPTYDTRNVVSATSWNKDLFRKLHRVLVTKSPVLGSSSLDICSSLYILCIVSIVYLVFGSH